MTAVLAVTGFILAAVFTAGACHRQRDHERRLRTYRALSPETTRNRRGL